MDIRERRRLGHVIRYQSMVDSYNRQQELNERQKEEESARQRRERDLADEKRRNEEELDKRLADTLKQEGYRPKPFGGEGYDEYKAEERLNEPSVEQQ